MCRICCYCTCALKSWFVCLSVTLQLGLYTFALAVKVVCTHAFRSS